MIFRLTTRSLFRGRSSYSRLRPSPGWPCAWVWRPCTSPPVGAQEPCSRGGYDTDPVAVEAVSIVVDCTSEECFALCVRSVLEEDITVEIPVRGDPGTRGYDHAGREPGGAAQGAPPDGEVPHRRPCDPADPADIDRDRIDDMPELADPAGMNPVNPAAAIALSGGAGAIPDRETFEAPLPRSVLMGTPTDSELSPT